MVFEMNRIPLYERGRDATRKSGLGSVGVILRIRRMQRLQAIKEIVENSIHRGFSVRVLAVNPAVQFESLFEPRLCGGQLHHWSKPKGGDKNGVHLREL